ncbi:MAG: DNA polymerase III subunit delta [Clostridia bacterium]|nr:DNA polymerase III subunit delta [Clostridia bacterium]
MRYGEFVSLSLPDVPPCLYVVGDRYFIRRVIASLTSKVDDFDKTLVSPPSTVTDGLDKAESFPLLSEKRVVVLREFSRLSDVDKGYLEKYAADPTPTTVFVLVGETFKSVKGYELVDCNVSDRAVVKEAIVFEMKNLGCFVTPAAINLLMDYCDEDMGKITSECVKLSSYVGKGGTVDVPDVEVCVTPDVSYKIYQLGDLVSNGKYAETYELVAKLGVEPTTLLATLTKYYRNVFYAKIYKGDSADLANYLKIKPYPLSLAAKTAKNYSAVALLNLLKLLYELEYKIKSGVTSGEEAMELAIAEAIERRKR